MGRPKKSHLGKPSVHRGQERVWWNGAWVNLGPAGSEKARAEYARLAALWAADPGAARLDPGELLLSTLCRDYLASADSPAGGLSRDRAVIAIELLMELHAATPVSAFGPNMLRAWQTWLCNLPSQKWPGKTRFNATSVNFHVDTIRRIWAWGVSTERIPDHRVAALRTVPRPKPGEAREPRVVEPVSLPHVLATLPHLLAQPRAMVVLQMACGARPGEICRMRPKDVHRSGVLHVPGAGPQNLDSLGVWAYLPEKHKGTWRKKPRFLMFAGDAQRVLAPFLDRDPNAHCFSPRESILGMWQERRAKHPEKYANAAPLVEDLRYADHYLPKTYYGCIEGAAQKAGVPHWFPYQLRHLAAAEVKLLFGLDAVQALLGHHSRTMAEHYGGVAFKTAAETAKKRAGEDATPRT